jgi:Fe-S-cluster containining protein
MGRDITYYCMKYNCGECCERGWNIFVTENDIKNWEESRPEILSEITSGIFDNKIKKLLKKRPVEFPDGKIRDICIFYDFKNKCLIHGVNPEICKKFACTKHLYFIFRLFNSLSHLIDELNSDSIGEI